VNDLASRGLKVLSDDQRIREMEVLIAELRAENEKLKLEYAALGDATVEIEQLAYHDPLTGLLNWRAFLDRLIIAMAEAIRGGPNIVVLYINLDGFRTTNVRHGKDAGDDVLRDVSRELKQCVSEGDTVARYREDEFLVLLLDIKNVEHILAVAAQILDRAKKIVPASIGIARFPGNGTSPQEVVESALAAMHRAKRSGGNRYELS
jgi:diguanylate cyclase (GGDEF)-like protein